MWIFTKLQCSFIKSTSEIMIIKKSIKINIFKISVYLDPLNEVFISLVEIILKIDILTKFGLF